MLNNYVNEKQLVNFGKFRSPLKFKHAKKEEFHRSFTMFKLATSCHVSISKTCFKDVLRK